MDPATRAPRYLAEWYQPEITDEDLDAIAAALDRSASSMRSHGLAVQRVMTLAVPAEEVVFSVFTASSQDTVAQVCRHAGVLLTRLTAAIEDHPGRSKY